MSPPRPRPETRMAPGRPLPPLTLPHLHSPCFAVPAPSAASSQDAAHIPSKLICALYYFLMIPSAGCNMTACESDTFLMAHVYDAVMQFHREFLSAALTSWQAHCHVLPPRHSFGCIHPHNLNALHSPPFYNAHEIERLMSISPGLCCCSSTPSPCYVTGWAL